mmetsp:Transcript_2934/g.8587  ORF Transcript_2934/g.8587 Transcript_2934/m.8587 type:complete len:108 (+) Transcript_2934:873-1196(+)
MSTGVVVGSTTMVAVLEILTLSEAARVCLLTAARPTVCLRSARAVKWNQPITSPIIIAMPAGVSASVLRLMGEAVCARHVGANVGEASSQWVSQRSFLAAARSQSSQ